MEPLSGEQLLREIYRLTRENNEMMHRARRSAFFWGFVKFIIYAALITAPIWFYITYLNGTVVQLMQEYNKVEGANAQVQNQFQSFESGLQQLETRFGYSTTSSSTQK